jgi:hypothetical protein
MVMAAGSDLPVEKRTAQGISYYNGGVGLDERARLPQEYSLKIVLATEEGLYLNNAEVRVADSGNEEVFRVRADNGPWLIADLVPGTYTIEATLEGSTTTPLRVTVKAGSKAVATLRWKSSEIDMGL